MGCVGFRLGFNFRVAFDWISCRGAFVADDLVCD